MDSPSEAIQAANNLEVRLGPNNWKLVSTELETPTTLVEASSEGFSVHPVFVKARRLPGATLSPAQVSRVVLGWAPESQAWRLGLLLQDATATPMDTTQLQWCELAAWPEDGQESQLHNTKMVAQALARLVGRPFQIVEPETPSRISSLRQKTQTVISLRDSEETYPVGEEAMIAQQAPSNNNTTGSNSAPAAAKIEAYPAIREVALPIRFGDWKLMRSAQGMAWRRTSMWWLVHWGRMVLFGALSALFLILGIGTRVSGLAEVEPTWLPIMGLVIGIFLLLSIVQMSWQLLNASGVTIDTHHGEIYKRGFVFPFINWRIPFNQIDFVLVTQTPARAQGRRRRTDAMRIAADVWLHVYDGKQFYLLADLERVEGKSVDWETVRSHTHTMVRRRLHLTQYDTPAHHAALKIAEAVGAPVYLDITS
jgi:hypothetical protein